MSKILSLSIFKRTFVMLITVFEIMLVGACQVQQTQVVTSKYEGRQYHHLKYSLHKDNIISIKEFSDEKIRLNGGQFELLINPAAFPIAAPNCRGELILRMPWTSPNLDKAQEYINEKLAVYKAALSLTKGDTDKGLDIYLELNPYVKLNKEQLNLTQCNIFSEMRMAAI